MHILLVNHAPIPVFAYGGTERVVWDLGKQLVALGHRVSYLVPTGSHCDFAQVLPLQPNQPWDAQIPADVDLTHFQFDPHTLPSTPYLVTEHANARDPKPLPLNTVFLSQNHAQRYGSTEYVYNGLDWEAYGPVDFERPRSRYHFLGKAAWSVKNVNGAIAVARKASVELDVLGGRRFNLKGGLRLTLSPHVHFHGMVGGEQKFNLLNGSRGLILPVRWHEPFGLAIIESLYFGCPVFSTPYGALPELIGPEYGALASTAQELADAIRSRVFDARACHAYAKQRFHARAMAEAYVRVYERILDGEQLHQQAPLMQGQARKLPWVQ